MMSPVTTSSLWFFGLGKLLRNLKGAPFKSWQNEHVEPAMSKDSNGEYLNVDVLHIYIYRLQHTSFPPTCNCWFSSCEIHFVAHSPQVFCFEVFFLTFSTTSMEGSFFAPRKEPSNTKVNLHGRRNLPFSFRSTVPILISLKLIDRRPLMQHRFRCRCKRHTWKIAETVL